MSRVLRYADSRRARMFVIGVVATTVLALLTGVAVAGFTVSSLEVAKVKVAGKSVTIVVDNRSVTVYELGGESLKNLQCVTRTCFNTWPPLKVSSAGSRVRKASGVPGTVSILRRPFTRAGMARIATVKSGPGGRWHWIAGPRIATTYEASIAGVASRSLMVGVRPALTMHVLSDDVLLSWDVGIASRGL